VGKGQARTGLNTIRSARGEGKARSVSVSAGVDGTGDVHLQRVSQSVIGEGRDNRNGENSYISSTQSSPLKSSPALTFS
jgi:hypothetical protein